MFEPRLLVTPSSFINTHVRHRCIAGLNGFRGPDGRVCEQVMVVPDDCTPGAPEVLTEGQIWGCGNCGALHEYYIAYEGGNKVGMVRLLKGEHRRDSGE